jgi:hypothetical protein
MPELTVQQRVKYLLLQPMREMFVVWEFDINFLDTEINPSFRREHFDASRQMRPINSLADILHPRMYILSSHIGACFLALHTCDTSEAS